MNNNKKDIIVGTILTIIMISVCVFMFKYKKHEDLLDEAVNRIETREVLDGKYINIEGIDYVILQIKYDDYSKLERYFMDKIIFKDIKGVDKPYLKTYLNRNNMILKNELYY